MRNLKLYAKNEKGQNSPIQTVRVFIKDLRMQFGIETPTILIMKTGEGIKLPDPLNHKRNEGQ